LGTWGPGPFENDAALDWLLVLGGSDDPGLPQNLLRGLDRASSHNARDGARAVAAAEAIAASRGHPGGRLPGEIHRWLAAAEPRADAAAADLAIGVLAKVAGEDSELRSLWAQALGSRWRSTVDDLGRRLREPARAVIAAAPGPPVPVPAQVGEVIQVLTSTGKAAYVQVAGRMEGHAFDLIRVMPGVFSPALDDADLASLVAGDTVFFSLGSARLLMGLAGSQDRGKYPVPGRCAGPQPVKHHRLAADAPGGGGVRYAGTSFSAEEFARMHPDIDQAMLTESAVPSPGTVLRMIERGWRPWMASADALILAEDPGPVPVVPQRPAAYPPTARPGNFLLDR
jgi:hypothetical protein